METLFITFFADLFMMKLIEAMPLPSNKYGIIFTYDSLSPLIWVLYAVPLLTIGLTFMYCYLRSVKQESDANQYVYG
ncbi:hypothetical protein [Methanocella sp. MCL-LM]|uniref:hypothetical protein n=1 Tax=Methanocella sp. MCL-LM TaxID=3412035 RepID=UPI003C71D854